MNTILNMVNDTKEYLSSNNNNNNKNELLFIKEFKKQKLEKRIKISDNIKLKYNDRIPIIIDSTYFKFGKNKYIVPKDMRIGNFIHMIKNKINLLPEQSIFLLCNNILLNGSDIINIIYEKYKEEDNFLYIIISLENVFGNK